MKSLIPVAISIALLLGGCETFYGPILKNVSAAPMDVAASYSDGSSYNVHLNSGSAFRQRVKGLMVEKLVVRQNGKSVEFGSTAILPLLTHVASSDEAVILIGDFGLEIISIAEAKKRFEPAK